MTGGAVIILAAAALTAQPAKPAVRTFTIQLREAKAGDRLRVEKDSGETSHYRLADAQGHQLQDQEQTRGDTFAYEETVLEKPKGATKPTRLRRHYEKAQTRTGDRTDPLPFEGKTVLIEKRDGTYHFQFEDGQELTKQEAEPLDKEFNRRAEDKLNFNKLFLPQGPVAVDQTWKIDPAPLVKDLEKDSKIEIDAAKAVAEGKLTRVYRKAGRRFGVLEFRIELPVKALAMAKQKAEVRPGSKFVVRATVDGCIDGSVNQTVAKFDNELDVEGEVTGPDDTRLKLAATAHMKGHESEREAPGK